MSSGEFEPGKVHSVTCAVHRSLGRALAVHLRDLGTGIVYREVGKSLRQRITRRPLGLPGKNRSLVDSPTELFRFSLPQKKSLSVMASLVQTLDLTLPGRGMIFSQEAMEYSTEKLLSPDISGSGKPALPFLSGLSLITCILSRPGGGDLFSRIALDLGTCVPLVTNGRGTGLRDQLGLLRITIPPDKEIVQIIVPEFDADNIIRILIEEGKLNRPGSGFLFRMPLHRGLVDTKLRIGTQEHAASMEQIISAIDELKSGTHWRKRFSDIGGSGYGKQQRLLHDYKTIILTGREGRTDNLVKAAMKAGAPGATISRLIRLDSGDQDNDTNARERSIISVPKKISPAVIKTLLEAEEMTPRYIDSLTVYDSPTIYSYSR